MRSLSTAIDGAKGDAKTPFREASAQVMARAEYIVEIRIPWYARAAMKLGAWLVFLGGRVFSWGSEKTRIVPV